MNARAGNRATVTDAAGGGETAPIGSVSFTNSGEGRFFGSSCALSGIGASASCAVFLTSFQRGGLSTLAGVSRATFYEQFDNKEQLFLACYQAGSDNQRTQVESALSRAPDPRRQARDAIVAYLGMLEADEDFARAFFVEAQIATASIRERFLTNQDGYVDLIREWHRAAGVSRLELPVASRTMWAGVIAGIAGLVTQHIRRNGVTGLVDELAEPSLSLMLAVAGISRQAPPSLRPS